jgi:hypothetical protein
MYAVFTILYTIDYINPFEVVLRSNLPPSLRPVKLSAIHISVPRSSATQLQPKAHISHIHSTTLPKEKALLISTKT